MYPYSSIKYLSIKLKKTVSSDRKKEAEGTPQKQFTDADYVDDIALLAKAPALAETLLHSLERTAAGIGLHVNAHTMEYTCFNQRGDISTLNGSSLKLVDKFTYLGSSVSSTETDINTRLTEAWTANDRYQSYGSQIRPIKRNAVSSTHIYTHYHAYIHNLRNAIFA